ncbi:MAG: adenylyl-sulfate kinase [Alphaproteobacteria bacterium]
MPTSPQSQSDTAYSTTAARRLMLVSQPQLLTSSIVEALSLPRVDLQVNDLTQMTLPVFNHAILSGDADVFLLVVDATFGLTRRDLWVKSLACLAYVPHIIVAIDNLGDREDAEGRFTALREELMDHASEIPCGRIDVVAVDFAKATNIAAPTDRPQWIEGPALLDLIAIANRQPPASTNTATDTSDQFSVYLCWNGQAPMLPGRRYLFDNGKDRLEAYVSTLKYRLNPETMEHQAAKSLVSGNVGYANLALDNEIAFRPFRDDHTGGSFRLFDIDSSAEVAFGIINFGLRRATNIRWHALAIDKSLRAGSKGQKPCILWFTGLSASGKSTVASLTEKKLHALGKHTYVLDGDNVRHGLCRDLGFTDADRVENLRRVSETAKLLVDAGLIVLVSFISPFRSERAAAREKFSDGEFIEIFVDTPIEVCEDRDPKGLYKKARAGQLKNFTGIDSPYEPPLSAEIVLPGGAAAPEELAERIIEILQQRDMLSPITLQKD